MSKMKILSLIEGELVKFAKTQSNLESESARQEIAKAILKAISAKYHLTEEKTQTRFE